MPAIRPEAVPRTERPSLPHQRLPAFRSAFPPLRPSRTPCAARPAQREESSPTVILSAAEASRSAFGGALTISPIPSTSAPPGRACETAATSVTQTASPGVPGLHHDPKSPVGPFVNSVRGHPEQPFSPTIHLPRLPTRLPWAEARISALPASHHRQFSIRNFQSPISPPDHAPTLIPPSFLAVRHSSFHIRHSTFSNSLFFSNLKKLLALTPASVIFTKPTSRPCSSQPQTSLPAASAVCCGKKIDKKRKKYFANFSTRSIYQPPHPPNPP